jgi:hypothetical protein
MSLLADQASIADGRTGHVGSHVAHRVLSLAAITKFRRCDADVGYPVLGLHHGQQVLDGRLVRLLVAGVDNAAG